MDRKLKCAASPRTVTRMPPAVPEVVRRLDHRQPDDCLSAAPPASGGPSAWPSTSAGCASARRAGPASRHRSPDPPARPMGARQTGCLANNAPPHANITDGTVIPLLGEPVAIATTARPGPLAVRPECLLCLPARATPGCTIARNSCATSLRGLPNASPSTPSPGPPSPRCACPRPALLGQLQPTAAFR